ncbi:MFS transporter [Actinospica durhamensis]|uniref:MFS transporter n=1 Tax=Actinospica durhamensis TaxID=1508375 RepID=A0A941IWI2_9ACTN|nr:MFS transporter [Actinospica durhamensis]MBR7839441.1 MFS transporter [Actinospica durhamensis]
MTTMADQADHAAVTANSVTGQPSAPSATRTPDATATPHASSTSSASSTSCASTSTSTSGKPASGSVWRNRRLQTLNLGAFAALTGIAISDVVYPLLILGFTGKPILAGLFGAIQFTAMVLASLPAGAFVDRHDRRHILITSELTRAVLATVLAVTLAAGHIWLAEIYLVAAALGACQPFSGIRTLAVRGVVPAEKVTAALTTQQIFTGVAALMGPALGAVMFTASRSLPFTVIAAGMGVSATCAYLVRFDSRPRAAAAPAAAAATSAATSAADEASPAADTTSAPDDSGPLAGLRIIWQSAVMRSTMLFIMMINLIGVPLDLVIIVEARHQGVPTRYLGAIFAMLAAGGIIGAPLVPRVHALLRPGQVLAVFGLATAAVMGLLAVPFGGFWMAGCIFSVGLLMPAVQILVNVLILQQVPDHQRGRVLSGVMTITGLGMPLGAALGGTLLQLLSATTVLIGAAAVVGCTTLGALLQRDLRAAQWPTSDADDAHA